MPLPRIRLRSMLIAVAVVAVFFAAFRLSSDVVYRVFLSVSFLAMTASGLVAASRPGRINLWSIVLLATGVLALVLAELFRPWETGLAPGTLSPRPATLGSGVSARPGGLAVALCFHL
jgi:hypothetical protein